MMCRKMDEATSMASSLHNEDDNDNNSNQSMT